MSARSSLPQPARLRPRWIFLAVGSLLLWAAPWPGAPWRVILAVCGLLLALNGARDLSKPPRVPARPRGAMKWVLRAAALFTTLAFVPGLGFPDVFLSLAALSCAIPAFLIVLRGYDELLGKPPRHPAPPEALWREPLAELLTMPERTRHATERWVENPWVLERLAAAEDVLDLGYVNADPVWHELVQGEQRRVFGLDIARGRVAGVRGALGDIRSMPFRDECLDVVIAISTIEHIGCDNTVYAVARDQAEQAGDLASMRELRRVLRPGGRALVTVPYGRAENHGWFRQYDAARLQELASAFEGEARTDYFVYEQGWRAADPAQLARCRYAAGEAPAATGLACLELRKPA